MRHFLAKRDARRLFTLGADAADSGRLYVHLRRCERDCRAYFDRLARLEAAGLGEEGATAASLERAGAAVLSRALPMPWRPSRTVMALTALALASLVAVLVPVLRHPTDELTSRGGAHSGEPTGVRVIRLAAGGSSAATGRLRLTDGMGFSYTNTGASFGYLMLLGVQDDRLRWYLPDDDEAKSAPIKTGVVDEALARGVRLSSQHLPGKLRVVAIFSSTPLARSDVERTLPRAGDAQAIETTLANDLGASTSVLLVDLEIEP